MIKWFKKILYRSKRIMRRLKYFPSFIKQSYEWDFETCKKCGCSYRLLWEVDDRLWTKVVGKNKPGCFCPTCFIKMAEKKGLYVDFTQLEPFYYKRLQK